MESGLYSGRNAIGPSAVPREQYHQPNRAYNEFDQQTQQSEEFYIILDVLGIPRNSFLFYLLLQRLTLLFLLFTLLITG